MSLTPDDVLHVARLARLGLTSAEVDLMTGQLDHIIEQFAILQQLDTSGVPPTAQVIAVQNVTRADEVRPSSPVEDVLANVPARGLTPMNLRRDNIEDVIKLIQERMDAAGVRKVTELPSPEREELIDALRALLQKQK